MKFWILPSLPCQHLIENFITALRSEHNDALDKLNFKKLYRLQNRSVEILYGNSSKYTIYYYKILSYMCVTLSNYFYKIENLFAVPCP